MRRLRDMSIKGKLLAIIMMTTAAALMLAGAMIVLAGNRLFLSRSITLQGKKLGILYFDYELSELAERLALYSALVGGIMLLTTLLALILSSRLRLLVSQPIASLAGTAKAVSENKDY